MLFLLLINIEMPTIVGISTFISRNKFMLSRLEHEQKSFITSGKVLIYIIDYRSLSLNIDIGTLIIEL